MTKQYWIWNSEYLLQFLFFGAQTPDLTSYPAPTKADDPSSYAISYLALLEAKLFVYPTTLKDGSLLYIDPTPSSPPADASNPVISSETETTLVSADKIIVLSLEII